MATIEAHHTLSRDKRERLITTASSNSSTYKLSNKSKSSIHLVLDNTDEVGTLKVQVSNDNANWVTVWYKDENEDLQTGGLAVTSGTDVNFIFDPLESYASYLRVSYTYTSGGDAARFIEIWVNDCTR